MQKIPFEISGLQTLVVKESNRIEALSEVAKRFGVELKPPWIAFHVWYILMNIFWKTIALVPIRTIELQCP